jgi:hypothetical protein
LVRLVHEVRVAHPERPVPVVRDTVVAEAVDVVDLQPVVIHGVEVVAGQRSVEVGALSEAAEVVLGEGPHERVFVEAQARVGVAIREVHAGVAVHGVEDHRDAVLVRHVDQLLEVRALAEPLVHAEVPDGQVPPVHRPGHVRQRHHLDGVHTEIVQVGHEVASALEVAAELGDVDLVEDEIGESRCAPGRLGGAPRVRLVAEREGGEPPHAEFARERINDPVQRADVGVVDLITIDVPAGGAPRRPRRRLRGARDGHGGGPEVAVRRPDAVGHREFPRRDAVQELIALVNDLHGHRVASAAVTHGSHNPNVTVPFVSIAPSAPSGSRLGGMAS